MNPQHIEKLEEAQSKNYIDKYEVIEERCVLFHTPTGRKFLYIHFNSTIPESEKTTLVDYFTERHKHKASFHVYFTNMLRVELEPVSETWANTTN